MVHEAPRRRPKKLEDRLRGVRDDVLDSDRKRKLVPLCRSFDELVRLDEEANEIFFDEKALRKLMRPHVPDSFVDDVIRRANGPGSTGVVRTAGSNARPILWEELMQRVAPSGEPPAHEALGLPPNYTAVDVESALKAKWPNIPAWAFDPGTAPGRFKRGLESLGARPTATEAVPLPDVEGFWNCVLRNIVFWAIVGLIVAIGTFIAGVIAAGPLAPVVAASFETFAYIWLGGSAISAIFCFFHYILGPLFR